MNKYKVRFLCPQTEEYELRSIGFDPLYVPKAINKYHFNIIKIKDVRAPAANILKQTALSKGADAGVATGVVNCSKKTTDIILAATDKQLESIVTSLKEQPFGLKRLSEELNKLLQRKYAQKLPLKVRNTCFDWGKKTYIMGILNVTPDSFSDGGDFVAVEKAISHVADMVANAVDIIDIGAESTRPFSDPVDSDIQLSRITPVLKELRIQFPDIPVSIDTRSHKVAQMCIEMGADIINDVSGLTYDQQMAGVIAVNNCPVVLMHSLATPEKMQNDPQYTHVVDDIYSFFIQAIDKAVEAGVKEENIILDPGIGFGKTFEHNLAIVRRCSEFLSLGRPVLVGASRKSFLGRLTGKSEKDRDNATTAINSYLVSQKIDILRVHNVALQAESSQLLDKLLR